MKNQLAEQQEQQRHILFSTNEVLKEEKGNKIIYYLPCYVRFKVKQLINIDIEALQGSVTGTLLFSFYYGELDRKIIDQFVDNDSKAILLQFSRMDSILLQTDKGITTKEDQKNKIVDFVVRQQWTCNLKGDVFFSPFQIINLYLTATIQSVTLQPRNNQGKKIDIKFNCLTNDFSMLISYGQSCELGLYSLANYFVGAKYSNKDKLPFKKIDVTQSQQQNYQSSKQVNDIVRGTLSRLDQTKISMNLIGGGGGATELMSSVASPTKIDSDAKIKSFQYAHFRMPFYQHPGINLISIFLPIFVLAFINLLVFFAQIGLQGRIAVIATITLAYIAFIPTINQTVPKTPKIKMVDILIYSQIFTTILSLIQSVIVFREEDEQTYKFDWRNDGWFIACLIINLISVGVIMVIYILHKCYWQPTYTGPSSQNRKEKSLVRKNWYSKECDDYFQTFFKGGRIKVI